MMSSKSAESRVDGMTLVELLIAMALVGVILAFVGSFFVSQARISADVQDRNELRLRLRTVAEGLAQDLQMAGARAVVENGTPRYEDLRKSDVADACGVVYTTCDDPNIESIDDLLVSVFYASSLRPQLEGTGGVCRNVVFRLLDGTLYRTDVECGTTLPDTSFGAVFASGITAVEFSFECTDGTTSEGDPAYCNDKRGIRAGTITIESEFRGAADETESLELTVTMPNTSDRDSE